MPGPSAAAPRDACALHPDRRGVAWVNGRPLCAGCLEARRRPATVVVPMPAAGPQGGPAPAAEPLVYPAAAPQLPPAPEPAPESGPVAVPVEEPQAPEPAEVTTPAGPAGRALGDWLGRAPTQGSRDRYRKCAAAYMVHALGLGPGDWEPELLLARYRGAVDAAEDRPSATGAWLQSWVAGMRDARKPDGTHRWRYATLAWRYAVAKSFAEWSMQGEVARWFARDVWRSFASRKEVARVRASLDPPMLGRIVRWLQPDARAWVSLARATGGRPWEVSNLGLADLDQTHGEPWWVWFRVTKEGGAEGGQARLSFADSEARRNLTEVMAARPPVDSALLFAPLGLTPREIYRQVHRDWARALKRLGLDQRGRDGRLTYQLYRLRSYFRTFGGSRSGFGRDVAEVCLGHHMPDTEAAYARYMDNPGLLASDYRAGEAALYCEAAAPA